MDTVPILSLLVALVLLVPPSAFLFSWSPIGRALTQRLKGEAVSDSHRLDEVLNAVVELQAMMDRVGADMEDMQDRLSFAERLLTAGAERAEELTPV